MNKNKKKIIIGGIAISTTTFAVLIALVLCVVLLTVGLVLILNLRKDDTTPTIDPGKDVPKSLVEGEGTFVNKITLYPEIPIKSILAIDVVDNKNGTKTSITSKAGDTKLYLKGYENIFSVRDSIYSSLAYIIRLGITLESEADLPIRDCTEEYMRELSLTEDSCYVSYTVKYLDENNNEQEKTVFIGEDSFTQGAKYVALKGRNSVYTMLSLDTFMDLTTEKCIDPIIYSRYTESTVATSIKGLFISLGSKPIVTLVNATELGAAYGEAVYKLQYPAKTLADSDYVLSVITSLFVNFSGDEVVSIKPDNATLEKYGFGDVNHIYGITAAHASGDESIFFISELQEDGYYYIRSQLYKEYNIDLIIRIPKGILSFLSDKEEDMVKWAATNTPLSGFYKYLHEDKEANQSGVSQITIKTMLPNKKFFEETFYITTEKRVIDGTERICIKVVPKSGKSNLFFEDDYSVLKDANDPLSSYKINQFRNFYMYLINYPMPRRFCTLTEEQIIESKTEENFMFEITVVTNDGNAERYSYYKNVENTSYVIREESIGTYDGENYHFDSVDIIFDTTRSHINILNEALEKLINGEFIDPREDLY